MRRFSVLAFRQQRRKFDLTFLKASESPLRTNADPRSEVAHSKSAAPTPEKPNISLHYAKERFRSAISRRDYNEAESWINKVPRLLEDGKAVFALVKVYCDQFDFVSAQALLCHGAGESGMAKVGDAGIAHFVTRLTYGARNVSMIDETFQRALDIHKQEGTTASPELVTTVLNGVLFLDDEELFHILWPELPRKVQKQTLESQVLRLLMNQDWQEAQSLWHEIVEDRVVVSLSTVWYVALRWFLAEQRDLASVARVLEIMEAEGLSLTSAHTALLLRYDAWGQTPSDDFSAAAKLASAKKRSVPLSRECAREAFSSAWSSRLPTKEFQSIRSSVFSRYHSSEEMEHMSYNPFWSAISRVNSEEKIFDVLREMLKKGMTIQYEMIVHCFEKAVRVSNKNSVYSAIDELSAVTRQLGFPLHCAGIDLSIVELHAKINAYNPPVVRTLVSEYLRQYPLVNNNIAQLTRLAVVLLNAHEPEAALTVIESRREDQEISKANSDCASLQVMLQAKFHLKEPLLPILASFRGLGIHFDNMFFRKAGLLLSLSGESPAILEELKAQNETILRHAREDALKALALVT